MKRIWVNARFLTQHLTGVQRYAYEVTRRLPHVELILPAAARSEYEPTWPPEVVHLSHFRLGQRRLPGHLWEQVALPLELPKSALLFSPSGCGPLALSEQVVTIHDVGPIEHPEWYGRLFGAWYRWMVPRLARHAKAILTVSEFSRQRILDTTGVAASKVTAIPLGVEPRFRVESVERVRAIVQQYKIPGPYILAVNALSSRKNVVRLHQAWSRIAGQYEGTYLVVVGQAGLAFSDLSACRSSASGILHLGAVPDDHLPALYTGAQAFVYPSLYEGFGLPPLEAMACGTAVVTSNVTSIPEVVGSNAVFVDPCDLDSIADGIKTILSDASLRQKLIDRGREIVKSYTWDRTASLTCEALKRAASG